MKAANAALGASDTCGWARSSGSRLPQASACCAASHTWRPSTSFADSSGVSAIQPAIARMARSAA